MHCNDAMRLGQEMDLLQDNCDEGRTGTRLTDVGNLPCGPAWVAPWNDDTVAGWADEVQETVTTQAVNMCE